MSRINTIELFENTKKIVVAENESLPQLDGSQLTGIVSNVNGINGNINLIAGSGLVSVTERENTNQIAIDVDIPNIASLFVYLDGKNVVADTYTITYTRSKYLVTIKHNLNSRVVGFLFDENDKQAFYGVDYIDNNTISIQFESSTFPTETNVWKVSLGLGGGLPITLSTDIPSSDSTNGTVTSSISVYNFVNDSINSVNNELELYKQENEEKFGIIDSNFDEVAVSFASVRTDFANADSTLNTKIDTEISRLNLVVEEIDKMMKEMGDLLDEINGIESSSEESSEESSGES